MLLKKIVCFSVFVFWICKSHAQVNLQTGSATFSIPMFNWQDDKSRLNSMVALSYNSGNGLKVSDVASNVGQGWNLIAGGVITRMQQGEPDDQQAYNGNGSDEDQTKYPAGYLYAKTAASNGCPLALTKYPIYGWKNQVYTQHNSTAEDKQLDYFSFQFNGKTGLFVLDQNGSDHGDLLGDSKIKITFQRDSTMISQGIRTTITSFSIQDVDGLIYKFTQHELTKVFHEAYCDAKGNNQLLQPNFSGGNVYYQKGFDDSKVVNPYVINSWYLSEIDDPLTGRKISFRYSTNTINNTAGTDISYNSNSNYAIVSYKISVTQTPVIDSIICPDGHNVIFKYGNPRFDLTGDSTLATVDITYQGRYLSEYRLNTSYFVANRYGKPTSSYQKSIARLCLRSVQKIGVDLKEDSPPYQFDYYLGSGGDDVVPAPFTYAKDIWGFYNGNNTKDYDGNQISLSMPISNLSLNQVLGLCFERRNSSSVTLNPNTSGYAKNGLLKQIIYPTGGTLTYQYNQNSGIIYGNTTSSYVGGVHVSQTSSTDGGFSNDCNHAISTSYNYILQDGSTSSLWGLEMPLNKTVMSSHYAPEYRSWHYTVLHNWSLFGSCYYHFLYPGVMFRQQAITLEGIQKFLVTYSAELNALSIITTISDLVTVIAGSTGFLAWVAVVVDILAGIYTVIYTCGHDFSKDESTTMYYSTDLNGISPLPAQFKRVEVVENPGTIGKTVQEFTSEDDYSLWIGYNLNTAFAPKQRFAPWAYGLPKLTTVYDSSGHKIKETKNVYNFNTHYSAHCGYSTHYDRSALLKTALKDSSAKCLVNHSTSQRNTDWSKSSIYDDPSSFQKGSISSLTVDIYDMYTGRTELDTTYDRVFKTNDPTQFVETKTGYVYNDENYQPELVTTIQSDGIQRQKNIFYTIDYLKNHTGCYLLTTNATTNPQIISLVQNNIVAMPVETNETVAMGGNPGIYISDKATLFTTLANGDIKPYKILEGRFSKPAAHNSPWPDDYASFDYTMPSPLLEPANPDYTFYKVAQTFSYDPSANLTGIKDEGGRSVYNIYDYNDKYVTASVINADPSVDKCFYTSFETTNLGGWSLSGASSYYGQGWPSVTGVSSFALLSQNANSLTASSLNASKPYILSFWSSNGNVSVSSGSTLAKSGPTMNGFTYYEYNISQGTSIVTITNNNASTNANIDELRLYPSTARMRTVTYDPLIGKNSECDENNRITYYEYDNLGRLKFIKDDNRNIVKAYEYNNVSPTKRNGCPGIYYSKLTSEVFTKSNCTSGYIGGQVTYTVPANKYISTISQEDADAQVDNELLTSGQAYADANGSCLPIYYNAAVSEIDTTQNCPEGSKPGTVTYTVPAGRYSSIISQADADKQASDDLAANGHAYANDPAHQSCTFTTDPDWTWDGISTYCQSVNGQLPPHQFVFETDLNPSSPTYNQTRWNDIGATDACPSGNYYNVGQSASFTRNNCASGYYGTSVTYTVPPGKYSSTVSQAAADQLATNDMNANGQAYANTNGSCFQIVYARLTYENTYYASDGTYWGNVVVRFYSDVSGTQPLSVSNLTVNYDVHDEYYGTDNYFSNVANGTYYSFSAQLTEPDPTCDPTIQACYMYNVDYSLRPGNYTIIQ